jgi:NAD(P)-dependent dehydrogenase (short-subunit alcohol dehydrogenase family)
MYPSVILITGVSSGIGRHTAEAFATLGHQVYGTVRNVKSTQPLQNVKLVQMDVTDDKSVVNAVDAIVKEAGRIDVLVNNAGIYLIGAIEESTIEDARKIFDTNFLGSLRTIQAVLPHMRAKKFGRIVNISSVLGFLPSPYMGLYAASKHAIEGLSETLDHEVRQFGIRVTLVQPAYTKTNLEANSPVASSVFQAYSTERQTVINAVNKSMENAPGPERVTNTIINAALGPWKMRHQPKGQAKFLSKIKRFAPASLIDSSLRKELGMS